MIIIGANWTKGRDKIILLSFFLSSFNLFLRHLLRDIYKLIPKEVTLRQRKPGRGHGLLPRSEEALLTCEHWDFYPGVTCTIHTTQVHVQERDVYGRHSFLNERCRRWKFLWVRFCQLWIHETWWKVWIKQPSLLKHHLAFCWFYDLISP